MICKIGDHLSCEHSTACCACVDSDCGKPGDCVAHLSDSASCPSERPEPACCRLATRSRGARSLLQNASAANVSGPPASFSQRPPPPGTSTSSVVCQTQARSTYDYTDSINLGTITTLTADTCASQCRLTTGCNVYLWCPSSLSDPAGCNDGFGTIYDGQTCLLLLQNEQPGGSLPQLEAGKTADFSSGDCRRPGAPAPSASAPSVRPPSGPAPSIRPSPAPAPSVRPSSAPAPSVRPPSGPAPSVRPLSGPALSVRPPSGPAPSVRSPSGPAPSVRPPPAQAPSALSSSLALPPQRTFALPRPVTPVPAPQASTSRDSFPLAAMAGAAGGVVALAIILAIGCWLLRRRRTRSVRIKSMPKAAVPQAVDTPVTADSDVDIFITSDREYGLKSITSTWTSNSGTNPFAASTTVSRSGDLATASTVSAASSTPAEFLAVQREYGLRSAQLPEPWQGRAGQEGVASILLHPKTQHVFLEAEEEQVRETWKINSKDLTCRFLDGKPIVLGEGGSGRVYWGRLHRADVAVKVITSHTPKQQQQFLRELNTLRACYNSHIVQFIGACVNEKQTFVVMEFMQRGDLRRHLDESGTKEFGWHRKGRQVALEVLQGLMYLHNRGIAHLDLNSYNILLTENDQAKIGDVGLGKMVRLMTAGPAQAGAHLWTAPEHFVGSEVGTSADIFSLGTVLWELCTAARPLQRVLREVDVPLEAPQGVADVIRRCREEDPSKRPTAVQVYYELLNAPQLRQ